MCLYSNIHIGELDTEYFCKAKIANLLVNSSRGCLYAPVDTLYAQSPHAPFSSANRLRGSVRLA